MYVCMYVCFRLAKLYSLVQTFSTWDVLQFRVYRVYIMTCQSNMSADVMYRDRCPLGGLLNRPAADENKGQGGNHWGWQDWNSRCLKDKDVAELLVRFRLIYKSMSGLCL